MNLFRSEDHVKRWPLYYRQAHDYVMPVGDWATVFSGPMFRNRMEPDYLARAPGYVQEYHHALQKLGKSLPAPDRVLTTVMFTDIVSSTEQAARVGDTGWLSLVELHNQEVRSQLEHYGGKEVKQTGDGFMATFDSPTRAIRCAVAVRRSVGELGLMVRAGIHSGECEVLPDDLGGMAVHIAARIAEAAAPGQVLVSSTVKEAVTGSDIDLQPQGRHQLKGVPGQWELHSVTSE